MGSEKSAETPRVGLGDMPAEIVQYIHILALNPFFPQTSRYINSVLSTASPVFVAKYLLDLYSLYGPNDIMVRALRHPVCDVEVAKDIKQIWDRRRGYNGNNRRPPTRNSDDDEGEGGPVSMVTARPLTCSELPRRLFRNVTSTSSQLDIFPLLEYLFETYNSSPNSHKGYPLCRAILTSNKPLIRFLLSRGADPSIKDNLAVQIAISKRDLEVVKLLVERRNTDLDLDEFNHCITQSTEICSPPKQSLLKGSQNSNKRPRLSDRVMIDQRLVQIAMESGSKDIVQYFVHEKGCMPPLRSIMKLNTASKVGKRK